MSIKNIKFIFMNLPKPEFYDEYQLYTDRNFELLNCS